MAITRVQDLGEAQVKTTGTTTLAISFAGATKPAVGHLVVAYCARDNVASDPLTGDSMSDGNGNTYSRVVDGVTLTSVSGGIVGVLFYSVLTVAWPAGTNTLTWTHPSISSVGARAFRAEHFTGASGLRASGSTTGTSTAGTPSAANTTPVSGDLVVGCIADEDSNANALTGDADTTNGSWSTLVQFGTTGGGGATNAKTGHQYKIVTGTGTQTYNAVSSATDTVAIIAVFQPSAAAGATSIVPSTRNIHRALLAR